MSACCHCCLTPQYRGVVSSLSYLQYHHTVNTGLSLIYNCLTRVAVQHLHTMEWQIRYVNLLLSCWWCDCVTLLSSSSTKVQAVRLNQNILSDEWAAHSVFARCRLTLCSANSILWLSMFKDRGSGTIWVRRQLLSTYFHVLLTCHKPRIKVCTWFRLSRGPKLTPLLLAGYRPLWRLSQPVVRFSQSTTQLIIAWRRSLPLPRQPHTDTTNWRQQWNSTAAFHIWILSSRQTVRQPTHHSRSVVIIHDTISPSASSLF